MPFDCLIITEGLEELNVYIFRVWVVQKNLLDHEDGGSRFLCIVSKCVPIYMVLYLRRRVCVLVQAVSCQSHRRDLGSVSG